MEKSARCWITTADASRRRDPPHRWRSLGLSDVPNAEKSCRHGFREGGEKFAAETFISEGKNRLIEETKAKMSLDVCSPRFSPAMWKELEHHREGRCAGLRGGGKTVSGEAFQRGSGCQDYSWQRRRHQNDVILASASNAIIIGFNVRPDAVAKATADREAWMCVCTRLSTTRSRMWRLP